jgi:Tfp pilus assembly pilus retraction ATPase PilT
MIETAVKMLREIAGTIPDTVPGMERQMLIGDLVSRQSPAERNALRALMDGFLLRMAKTNASDIDFGGSGTANRIWYRVYGEKQPCVELGEFNLNETDVLIQTILVERQRLFLYENRNLDFSYSLQDGELTYRFRANTSFDLDHLASNMRAIANTVRPCIPISPGP